MRTPGPLAHSSAIMKTLLNNRPRTGNCSPLKNKTKTDTNIAQTQTQTKTNADTNTTHRLETFARTHIHGVNDTDTGTQRVHCVPAENGACRQRMVQAAHVRHRAAVVRPPHLRIFRSKLARQRTGPRVSRSVEMRSKVLAYTQRGRSGKRGQSQPTPERGRGTTYMQQAAAAVSA